MAMLAEKRRKSKFVLTPVAKPLWTLETSHFGKKMMEKMGWAAGKGLGASEQGIHEPLRATYKQDSKGMGYSGQGNPFENLDQFNALLASLSGEVSTEDVAHSFQSLEEKSKQSRSRVHYKKFTRGKDVSRYSNVDLSCIVGVGKKLEEETVEEEVDHTGEEEHSHGVTTINSGSIADYFMLKMRKKNDQPETDSAFGSEFVQNDEEIGANKSFVISEEVATVSIKHKKVKKNKKNRDDLKILESVCDEEITVFPQKMAELLNYCEKEGKDNTIVEPLKVKSKKKKKHKEKSFDFIEEVDGDNCDINELEVEKKTKKKKKRDKELCDDPMNQSNHSDDVPENPENKKHKSKKRKEQDKQVDSFVDSKKTNINLEEDGTTVELERSTSKKLKHRRDGYEDISIDNLDIITKHKKKKKKDKVKIESGESIEPEESDCNNISKSEKKKRKKDKIIEECDDHREAICEGSHKKKIKVIQEDNAKYERNSGTESKNDNKDEPNESILNHIDEKSLQSDEILKQFKGSNLGSLPGYGHRRGNYTGH